MVPHLRYPKSGDRDTVDHVFPQAFRGPDAPGNVGLMRHVCNAKKGQRPPTPREIAALEQINLILGWPTPDILRAM